MANAKFKHNIVVGLMLVVAAAGGYLLWRPGQTVPIIGVVRTTEIRIAPEVGGQLAAIKVKKGDQVRIGDVVAELSALELTASVTQARAALAAAKADRDHVYAGVRAEEMASLAAAIAKAKSRLEYAGLQYDARGISGAHYGRLATEPRPGCKRRWQPRVPTSPKRRPTTPRRKPGRQKSSVLSLTRRFRRRRPPSRSSSAGSTKRRCWRRPTAWSPWSWPRSARPFASASRCWRSRRPASDGYLSTCARTS